MSKPIIFQIVGYSKTGKTAFLTKLIENLKKSSYTVAAIKSAKEHKYTYSKKDSDRFMLSGSDLSAVIFSDSTNLILNKKIELDYFINMISNFSYYDFILLEGFKTSNYNKILILSNNKSEEELYDLKNINYILCPIHQYDINEIDKKVNIDYSNIFHQSEELVGIIQKLREDDKNE